MSFNGSPSPSPSKFSSAEKRAVHNALERKRRDHIKDMFSQLRESVPNLAGEKVSIKASRAQILKKACDYIQLMRKKNLLSSKELDELTSQVERTKRQILKLESLRATNRYVSSLPENPTSKLPVPMYTIPVSSSANTPGGSLVLTPPPPLLQHQSIRVPTGPGQPPVVSTITAQLPGGLTGSFPLSLTSMPMDSLNLMARLPSLSSIQRIYVADMPVHSSAQLDPGQQSLRPGTPSAQHKL